MQSLDLGPNQHGRERVSLQGLLACSGRVHMCNMRVHMCNVHICGHIGADFSSPPFEEMTLFSQRQILKVGPILSGPPPSCPPWPAPSCRRPAPGLRVGPPRSRDVGSAISAGR